ncbi:hypothetical protein FH972_024847 [Carpinus fangiana]|uniref:Conserved oligomeric Golgi complex subunit 1 n=1 Tax=Carpinus fangiana TaxID=176857 RepID=A0A5N6KZA4_9ROSI|nr:hypothetical protein FH972_024847 [Carpinus fangiana]
MATSSAPDPRTFTAWTEAFTYPIPTTRQLERRLRTDATAASTKLRDLVGASYRDLLDTANAIVDIHGQTEDVERLLRKVGGRLDVRGIERGGRNIREWRNRGGDAADRKERLKRSAMAGVLRGAVTYVEAVVTGEIGADGNTLTAAKVLVVGRLVGKALSARQEDADKKTVEVWGRRLGNARLKLLRLLDRRLQRPRGADDNIDPESITALVRDLSAFALATSSTPSEVLRHFHHVRLEAIRDQRLGPKSKSSLVRRLRLYFRTLKESKATFVDLMAASLKTLAAGTLLQDPCVKGLEQLGLDINAHWIDEDVRNFTPWTRHEELSKAKADELQKAWSAEALVALSETITVDLEGLDNIQTVVDGRKAFLQTWLTGRQYVRHLDERPALDRLRSPFRARIIALLSNRFADLESAVHDPLAQLLSDETSIEKPPSLWSADITSHDVGQGAVSFKARIVTARRGHSPSITTMLVRFDAAAESIAQAQILVKQMRDTKWDDDYDDASSDEDENSKDASISHDTLSNADPQAIQTALAHSTTTAYAKLDAFLQEQTGTSENLTKINCNAPNAPGVLVLRVLNELRARAPQGDHFLNTQQHLQAKLAQHVSTQTAPVLASALRRTYVSNHKGDAGFSLTMLWDNSDPSLPVQPSPAAIRVLKHAVQIMGDLGPDLWGEKDAVQMLKSELFTVVREAVQTCVAVVESNKGASQNIQNGHTSSGGDTTQAEGSESKTKDRTIEGNDHNGTEVKEEPVAVGGNSDLMEGVGAQKKQKLVQLLFDVLYLQRALAPAADTDGIPDVLLDALGEPFDKDDTEELSRLRKAANDYWKRTYLLFGLLV